MPCVSVNMTNNRNVCSVLAIVLWHYFLILKKWQAWEKQYDKINWAKEASLMTPMKAIAKIMSTDLWVTFLLSLKAQRERSAGTQNTQKIQKNPGYVQCAVSPILNSERWVISGNGDRLHPVYGWVTLLPPLVRTDKESSHFGNGWVALSRTIAL